MLRFSLEQQPAHLYSSLTCRQRYALHAVLAEQLLNGYHAIYASLQLVHHECSAKTGITMTVGGGYHMHKALNVRPGRQEGGSCEGEVGFQRGVAVDPHSQLQGG